jgi:hypothetical protein
MPLKNNERTVKTGIVSKRSGLATQIRHLFVSPFQLLTF